MPALVDSYERWNSRAPTGRINYLMTRLAVSLVGSGGATGIDRIKYVTQVRAPGATCSPWVKGRGRGWRTQLEGSLGPPAAGGGST
jgi:hypothetical protein